MRKLDVRCPVCGGPCEQYQDDDELTQFLRSKHYDEGIELLELIAFRGEENESLHSCGGTDESNGSRVSGQ